MLKKTFFSLFFISIISFCNAQLLESFAHRAEAGVSTGIGHYFGDLTPSNSLGSLHPKLAASLFYQHQLNDYLGLKAACSYVALGYSDAYNEEVYKKRNLSFNTDVWEFALTGSFNFFRFAPHFAEYSFTPYVSLGIGVFSYNPYTYYKGKQYFLRELGTEGQGSTQYPNLKQYSKYALSIPLSIGAKYALTENMNIFGEFCFRFTNTDYLDDVSTNYTDAYNNQTTSLSYILHDRSGELKSNSYKNIFSEGQQRGNSKQNDVFATLQVGVSFNINYYKCP